MRRKFGGHFWTVAPHVRHALRRPTVPAATPWETPIEDPTVGTVHARGDLRLEPNATTILVLVHGLGGTPSSGYVLAAIRDAHTMGWSTLSLSMRGAARCGEDLFHSGLTDDLHAAVAHPEIAKHSRIMVLGFSVGGHIVLHFAHEQSGVEGSNRKCAWPPNPKVRACAALSPPLDLQHALNHIDSRRRSIYRRHVMRGLFAHYRALADRRDVPATTEDVLATRTLREWDALTVVPRFGFESPEQYYRDQSVAPYLRRLRIPTLLVAAEKDPMVPGKVIRPYLPSPGEGSLEIRWLRRGGHLGAPGTADLGFGGRPGVVPQVLRWMDSADREDETPAPGDSGAPLPAN